MAEIFGIDMDRPLIVRSSSVNISGLVDQIGSKLWYFWPARAQYEWIQKAKNLLVIENFLENFKKKFSGTK